jgi:hypothetical protein
VQLGWVRSAAATSCSSRPEVRGGLLGRVAGSLLLAAGRNLAL